MELAPNPQQKWQEPFFGRLSRDNLAELVQQIIKQLNPFAVHQHKFVNFHFIISPSAYAHHLHLFRTDFHIKLSDDLIQVIH